MNWVIYNIIFVKVAEVFEVDDAPARYEELIEYIKPVYYRWQKLAYPDKSQDNQISAEDMPQDNSISELEDV